jgi:hypothetical protein
MTSLAIEELPPLIKQDVEEFLENHPRSPQRGFGRGWEWSATFGWLSSGQMSERALVD